MALTPTVHSFTIELADVDRGVYEKFDLRVARQPSETAPYMLSRVLAYSLEYTEGISLTEGVASGDEPAVLVHDLTGRLTAWIEVGAPDADRIHRATKSAGRVAIYTHRPLRVVMEQLSGKKIHRAHDVAIYTFGNGFVGDVAEAVERRAVLAVTVTERQLYLDVNGRTYTTSIETHRLPVC